MSGILFLEPIDGWSFRDGKPFEAGEAFDAASFFPPSPWSTAGCVRTALLRKHCPDPERYAGRGLSEDCPKCGHGPCAAVPIVGPAGEPAPFSIGPPLLARCRKATGLHIYYPTPGDLVLEGEEDGKPSKAHIMAPLALPAGASCSLETLRPVGVAVRGRLSPFSVDYLETAELSEYLDGRTPPPSELPPKVYSEPRIGVGIDPANRSAFEGKLYIRDLVRLEEGAGLALTTGVDLGLQGEIGRLGGDGRMVSLSSIAGISRPEMPKALGSRLKLYLASPTFFKKGWLPDFLDPDSMEGRYGGCSPVLKLEAALIKETRPVGGWDLYKQQPREMRNLVGAGSIFYFKVLSGDADQVAERIHGNAFCDDDAMSMAGFGLAFVGRY